MEKLDHMIARAGMGVHQGIKYAIATHHATQRNHAIGHAFGKVQHIGHDTKVVGPKAHPQATESGDHFIKNQQDAVLVTNRSQALQIVCWRHIPPRASRHRLHHNRRHIARIVQRKNALFQII